MARKKCQRKKEKNRNKQRNKGSTDQTTVETAENNNCARISKERISSVRVVFEFGSFVRRAIELVS